MAGEGWAIMPFDEAVQVNPSVSLTRGTIYPFVDMQAIDPASRSVRPSERREFTGGGSRFIEGDTLMARITPCLENGKIARFVSDNDQKIGHGSTEFIVIRGKPKVTDNDFAYYLTKWDGVRLYCISQMTGSSGRQRVPTTALSQCEVTIPPLKEQQAIACILGALDDKIELNRQLNRTLEAMARAIFKSWFVDFDPVRAKAAGQPPPGLKPEFAALFPDSFEDSYLGEIPRGWTNIPLYDLATYVNGAAYRAFEPNDERRGLPIIKIAELKAGITPQTKFSDIAMPEKYRIHRGDILFSWSGSPDTSIDTFVWHYEQAWLNQHIFRVLPHRQEERAFVLSTLKHLRPVFAEIARNKQTTGLGHVTVQDMKRLIVIKPDDGVLRSWNQVAGPLQNRAFRNDIENHIMSSMRDALLPKLISGELAIPDAERVVGRCI